MFQRPFHCCVGHGFTNRHHPEEGASRAPSCRQCSGLWWQVHCISIRWQNYKGEVFQRLFICSTGVFNNQEQWPHRKDGPWQLLQRSSFRSNVLPAAHFHSSPLCWACTTCLQSCMANQIQVQMQLRKDFVFCVLFWLDCFYMLQH